MKDMELHINLVKIMPTYSTVVIWEICVIV